MGHRSGNGDRGRIQEQGGPGATTFFLATTTLLALGLGQSIGKNLDRRDLYWMERR